MSQPPERSRSFEQVEGEPTRWRVDWAGQPWGLDLGTMNPGMRLEGHQHGLALALEGLSEPRRHAARAFSPATLCDVDHRGDAVTATYRPLGWGALQVRASWRILGAQGIELLVEIQARTVDRLHAFEVGLITALGALPEPGSHRSVAPRDAGAAALSYDGRETDLAALSTGPPTPVLEPWMAPKTVLPNLTYIEMAYPHDASRRIHEGKLPFATARYGLFGYDIEKGIVLRARLRGFWVAKASALGDAERAWDSFVNEPLPLSREAV